MAMPNPFWKGAAKVLLHKHAFNPQPATPADAPTPSTGWATAAQRFMEAPPQHKAAADGFQLDDYLLADQVFADAPKVPDSQKALVKRPKRPVVQVSNSLKLLLQSTAALQKQQQQLTQTPAACRLTLHKQLGASNPLLKATPANQVVLKKRTKPALTMPSLAQAASEQQPEASAGQSIDAQLYGTANVTAVSGLGAKRPAMHTGSGLAPTLLKRPKLSQTLKPPASKAGGSQPKAAAAAGKGKAAGKPAASRKAVPTVHAKALAGQSALAAIGSMQVTGSAAKVASAIPVGPAINGPPGAVHAPIESTSAQAASAAASAQVAAAAAADAPSKAPRQRKKADDIDLADVEKKIREKQAAGRLQDLSIPELKCFLKACKLPVGGKKSNLLARVEPLLAKA